MSYTFGPKSLKVRSTLCPELVEIVDKVILVYDVSLIEGHRPEEIQTAAFNSGASRVQWPHSDHNVFPSNAVDVWPFLHEYSGVRIYESLSGHPKQVARLARKLKCSKSKVHQIMVEEYQKMIGVFMGVGAALGYKLQSGSDWDSDLDRSDQKFIDLPHIAFKGTL